MWDHLFPLIGHSKEGLYNSPTQKTLMSLCLSVCLLNQSYNRLIPGPINIVLETKPDDQDDQDDQENQDDQDDQMGPQKIPQPFRIKKITQLLVTKKITQPLREKNHKTSEDKKYHAKSRNLLEQKKI